MMRKGGDVAEAASLFFFGKISLILFSQKIFVVGDDASQRRNAQAVRSAGLGSKQRQSRTCALR